MLQLLTSSPARPGYFARRWHAQVAWQTLFWRDMLMVGTVANLVMGFMSLVLLAQRVDTGWSLGLHFALLPYNLFLLVAVWRWPDMPQKWKWVATVWFTATLFV